MIWTDAIIDLHAQGKPYCLVTVLHTKGSSPRDSGTKMVVSHDQSYDTIGGGSLEHIATNISRVLLRNGDNVQHIQTFNLGKDLKQCCGGVVTLLFECFERKMAHLVLFGAGHIAKELVPLLSSLDYQIHWYDSRDDIFPDTIPANVHTMRLDKLDLDVDACPANAEYLIMTHDHAIDQALCEAILTRGDFLFCGLIGSKAKKVKFNKRLSKKGFSSKEISGITCPIGLPMVKGKKPVEIAISVAAHLISMQNMRTDLNPLPKNKSVEIDLQTDVETPSLQASQSDIAI